MNQNVSTNMNHIVGHITTVMQTLPSANFTRLAEHTAAAEALLRAAEGSDNDALRGVRHNLDEAGTHLEEIQGTMDTTQAELRKYAYEVTGVAALAPIVTIENNVVVSPDEIDIPPGERYFAVDNDGTIRPRDPITGEVIYPGEIPPSLLMDPELRAGFEFWRQFGSETNVRLLLTRHQEAQDLEAAGIDLRAEAERLAATGGKLFFEGVSTARHAEETDQYLSYVASSSPEWHAEIISDLEDVAQESPFFGFMAARAIAIMGTGVRIGRPDFIRDSSRPADKALAAWDTEVEAVRAQTREHGSSPETRAAYARLVLGSIYYRNMYFVGKMGAQMSEQHKPGYVDECALLAGAAHEGVADILTALNVPVTNIGEPDISLGSRLFVACQRRGEMTAEQLRLLTNDPAPVTPLA